MRIVRVAVLAVLVVGFATACGARPVIPQPTPTYRVAPVVLPAQLNIMSDGATFCATQKNAQDEVLGIGLKNNDSTAVRLDSIQFGSIAGGSIAGSWTVNPPADLDTHGLLATSVFDYPPKIPDWKSRAQLSGTTLAPGASTYVLMRLVRNPGAATASFVDAGIAYTKSGHRFVAQGTSSGFEYKPGGHCSFGTP